MSLTYGTGQSVRVMNNTAHEAPSRIRLTRFVIAMGTIVTTDGRQSF